MEIEFDSKRWNPAVALLILLVASIGLGALGRAITPEGDRLLAWSDWQVLRARQAYRAELAQLRLDAEALAGLLNLAPDPVRAQMLADQVLNHTAEGQDALAAQRLAISDAALYVRDWAVGTADYATAQEALSYAFQVLQEASGP